MTSSPKIAAILVAAGKGARLGGALPKQYQALCGMPVLRHGALALCRHPAIGRLVTVIDPSMAGPAAQALAGLGLPAAIAGGASRQQSVLRGLEALANDPPDLVLIHDAARPFLDAGTIDRVIAALDTSEAAAPALPVADTLRRPGAGLVDRAGLCAMQTPQGFHYAAILAAHRAAAGADLTDDVAVAEQAGLSVTLVPGARRNFKLTEGEDMGMAQQLAEGAAEYRTGFGFDIHRLTAGTDITLAGVTFAHGARLDGHSDADVALHALTDALLGAIGAGDIGIHFPPGDDTWKDADSAIFVAHAVNEVHRLGGQIVHADLTIVCEAPKIAPHRDAMLARLAELLHVTPDRVSIKATTMEGLGALGRGEGIAAQAVATVRLPR